MPVPSQAEIQEMERLSRILDGERPAPTAATLTTSAGAPNPDAIILQKGPSSADVDDMSKIMQRFSSVTGVKSFKNLHDVEQSATDTVKTLINESQNQSELREALRTSQTDNGVCIGAWEITKHAQNTTSSKPNYIYRVHNSNTGQKIKASFLIAESAHAVVKLLNSGVDITHPTIKKIAKYEIEYRNYRRMALEEKDNYQRAKKKNREFKMNLYEAKFDAAKSKALLVRERIINIYHQI